MKLFAYLRYLQISSIRWEYLKPSNCVQIINIRKEYLKPFDCVKIIHFR